MKVCNYTVSNYNPTGYDIAFPTKRMSILETKIILRDYLLIFATRMTTKLFKGVHVNIHLWRQMWKI